MCKQHMYMSCNTTTHVEVQYLKQIVVGDLNFQFCKFPIIKTHIFNAILLKNYQWWCHSQVSVLLMRNKNRSVKLVSFFINKNKLVKNSIEIKSTKVCGKFNTPLY